MSCAKSIVLNTLSEFAGPQPDPVLPIFLAKCSELLSLSMWSLLIIGHLGSTHILSFTLYFFKSSNSLNKTSGFTKTPAPIMSLAPVCTKPDGVNLKPYFSPLNSTECPAFGPTPARAIMSGLSLLQR